MQQIIKAIAQALAAIFSKKKPEPAMPPLPELNEQPAPMRSSRWVKSLHPNMQAFLDMISHAEGTDRFGDQDGYNVIVGGDLFDSYADHPNVRVWLPAYNIHSTAAGRYQILHRYWLHYKKQLGLPDFSPESQDRYAIQQIRERRAYDDVIAGRIPEAIEKCRNIWASLPGAGYGQREVPVQKLVAYYRQKGGEAV